MRTFTVTVPDDTDIWVVHRAVIEAIEPGAGDHCHEWLYVDADPEGHAGYRHPRTGISTAIVPGPASHITR